MLLSLQKDTLSSDNHLFLQLYRNENRILILKTTFMRKFALKKVTANSKLNKKNIGYFYVFQNKKKEPKNMNNNNSKRTL